MLEYKCIDIYIYSYVTASYEKGQELKREQRGIYGKFGEQKVKEEMI